MEGGVRVLPFGTATGRRPAKVDRVLRDECPIPVDNKPLEAPVLPAALLQPHDMRGVAVSAALSALCQFGAEAFVDQQLHSAFRRRKIERSARILARSGNS